MKIYAIRHGQTDLNAQGRIQGCKSDLPLNDEGKKQALAIAEVFADKSIDLIVTSPLKRAMETADIIAERLDIGRDKIIKGTRLYERDFGDYEGKPMSEVDINGLRRWTDNAPTPNGETIRELAGRVFDYLDDRLGEMEEIASRDLRLCLYDQYDREHGHKDYKANSEIRSKAIKKALEELGTTVLFVVHGHVLRTMYWYFNGLPEDDNETVIETDNCGFYEFDTDKIPPSMKDCQIILDRRTLEERLKRLSRSTYKASYATCFAMCYMIGDFETTYEDYVCPVCGKKTKHNSGRIRDLYHAQKAVEEITKSRFSVDAVIDAREYCHRCFGKTLSYPSPVLKIRFSPDEEYHEERTGNYYDYDCLTAFIKCMDEYKGDSDSMSMSDWHHPLVDKIDQIVRMTGLCPEIVKDWKAMVAKIKAEDAENANRKVKAELQKTNGVLTEKIARNIDGGVVIPHNCTKIGDGAFSDRGDITHIDIPDSVVSIGKEAFKGCDLRHITIPDSVTHIGKRAFAWCSDLKTATLSNNLTGIAQEMFEYCYSLERITIPEKVSNIGAMAFKRCFGLKSVTMPDGVTHIGEGAFGGCEKLKDIIIPDSVVYIGEDAFEGCNKLSKTARAKIDKFFMDSGGS